MKSFDTQPSWPAEAGEPVVQFDNPRVQAVYEILCGDDDPPIGEHWEGWVSRRIVDALSAQARTVPANVMAALDRMCTPLDESVLRGATAEADAHSMRLIRDYVLSTPQPAQTAQPVEQTRALTDEQVQAIMTQVQVFASAYSLVGTRFDNGDGFEHSEAMKDEIRVLLTVARPASGEAE